MAEQPPVQQQPQGLFPVLKRAAGLLTSQGKPVPVIQEALFSEDADAVGSKPLMGSPSGSFNDSSLRKSISKRLSKVKTAPLVRNISTRVQGDHNQIRKRHGRAASESQVSRPLGVDVVSATHKLRRSIDTRPLVLSETKMEMAAGEEMSPSVQTNRKASMMDIPVPPLLQQGVPMTKVSAKTQKTYTFQLDADQGQIIWESKKLRIIPIENIKELRSGSDARYYRQQFQLAQQYEDRWITIIYILDGQYKTLHLIASSRDTFHLWDITLRKLYAIRQELMTGLGNEEIRHAVWIKQYWKSSDEREDHTLTLEEVEKLCRRLNINSSSEDLMRLFKRADTQNRGYLDFTDFQKFVKLLKARPDIDLLYKKLCSNAGGKLTFTIFEDFMHETQKSRQQDLKSIFNRYMQSREEAASRGPSKAEQSDASASGEQPQLVSCESTMSLDGFTAFLLSSDNAACNDQHGRIFQDMTQPLSDYFISSSHNTYLVGHQLVGVSTIEGYIRALLHSCRSVELDIYDGDAEPMVFHGKTFTSKVSVREVCEAIAKYAFVTSPYPIIISAEIHCSLPQQDMLASIMREVFGEALVSAPIEGRPNFEQLPSPEDLKGRILLKAKNLYVSENEAIRPKEVLVDTESSSTETSASDTDVVHEAKEEWRKAKLREMEAVKDLKQEFRKARNVFNRVRGHQTSEKSVTSLFVNQVTATSTAILESPPKSETKQDGKVKMSLAIVALLVYTVGVKCRGINKKEHYAPEHVFSLSETTANKIIKQGMVDLIKHNKTHLVRIYPKGLRLNSTNYLPHRYWAAGSQLVALNWQTFDLGYMINHAMFQRNGRAGYVLKPEALRTPEKEQLLRRSQHYLDVTIISAQQLPRPKDALGREIVDKNIVDPYVEVSVHIPDWPQLPLSSSPASTSSSQSSSSSQSRTVTVRTSAVKNNGFNPVWQESLRLPFDCAANMFDLVFVRFVVQRDGENDDEPIAVYCTSLANLALGYRHLPLHDSQSSQYLFSTLFVKCSIQDA